MGTVALTGASSSASAGGPPTATTGTHTGHVVALAEEKLPTKTDARKRTYPSLPGSVRELPTGNRKNAPFDVESYFRALPEENAAPLYLDALYEFSPDDMKACISPAEHQARGAALQERFVRTMDLMRKDQATVNPAFRAGTVVEYKEAFEKLATAQKRKRCVFDAGIGVDILLPHAQASRQAVRLLDWRTEADLADERIDAAIDNVEIALRLSRDLRPRGYVISQLVSFALDAVVMSNFVPPILAAAELETADCERLLDILARHEADSVDSLSVAFQTEYLVICDLLDRLERKDPTIPREVAEKIQVPAGMTAADFAAEVGALNECLGPLVQPRIRGLRALVEFQPEQAAAAQRMKIAGPLLPGIPQIVEALCRDRTRLGATRCLVALRRWQIMNGKERPVDLIPVCQAAGMKSVPLDAFSRSDKPLRFTRLDGEFVIYSVAPDGKDNQARRQWNFAPDAGDSDWIFRLPPIRKRAE